MTRPRPSDFVAARAQEEGIRAVIDCGFTERQARFLVLVMHHAGVCVPRQYAHFASVAYGAKCNAFFGRLVRRGFARAIDCIHNRARLYHVHSKSLYHVIGDARSRYRRPVPPRLARERLMLLDAVLTTPDLEWLTTAGEKTDYLARLAAAPKAATEQTRQPEPASKPLAALAGAFPIGVEPDGRTVLLYLVTDVATDAFRSFLQGHAALLRVAPTWTLRIAFPRFTEMYRRWLKHGNAVFEGPSAPVIAEALTSGAGRVETLVLPHSYRHLSPLVDRMRSRTGKVEKGAEPQDEASARPQPPSSTPWSSRERSLLM